MPVDYSRTKIYTIRSPHTNKIYVGATTKHYLSQRMEGHRKEYKSFLEGKRNSCTTSRFILECGEAYIQLEEKFPCSSIEESNKKEREYIDKYGERRVNIQKPCRTMKEWRDDNKDKIREYREQNKEQISTNMKEWYEDNYKENKERMARAKEYYKDNKERIFAQQKEPFTCPYCSITIQIVNKARHFRSKFCREAREAQEAQEEEIEIIFED